MAWFVYGKMHVSASAFSDWYFRDMCKAFNESTAFLAEKDLFF
jgi:hypothetical protein